MVIVRSSAIRRKGPKCCFDQGQRDERSAADIAAVWPGDGSADEFCDVDSIVRAVSFDHPLKTENVIANQSPCSNNQTI